MRRHLIHFSVVYSRYLKEIQFKNFREKRYKGIDSGESTDTAAASLIDLGLVTVSATAAMFYCLTPELLLLRRLGIVH